MMLRFEKFIFFSGCLFLLTSCDKGYQIRFSNYYTEPMDSVVIGNNKIVFKNIERQVTTDFNKISRGKYGITCISKTKKVFTSSVFIPGHGNGRRTIQIDGLNQISILEE